MILNSISLLVALFYLSFAIALNPPFIHKQAALTSLFGSSINPEEIGKKCDPVRMRNKIRPSLHPITINIISEALLKHSSKTSTIQLDVEEKELNPHEVALSSGRIAMEALERRRTAILSDDGDEFMLFDIEEGRTVAGRAVGVIMRMRELERLLCSKVSDVQWVQKYKEYDTFGVLDQECNKNDETREKEVQKICEERILSDPLFRLNRAECLLALFLSQIESPQLQAKNITLPGGSNVDFIDSDKIDVLL